MLVEILISFFIVLAGVFGLVGSVGVIKLHDTMQRLHAPTKATTLGVGGVLIASMLYFLLVKNSLSFHELLITIFLFLTAPVSAHFVAKTYIQAKMKQEELPGSEGEFGWAIYDDPPAYYDQD
ncbi:Na+/H+ antiporter subunit G [Shimia sagamensis]|uniref:Multicomponent K+:H+ antiporter subunit G n=1 Tax=Shimia sagamensis TaxID=1566352 RepID=A0ABY1PAH2_9RHOB|nr:Na+/H+ antiporter subunit G [Shimia sagamensis]SMP28882.1 multicomponent K+:H+ antiporter subunit G [Shimia sagamensis]